jgi:hypothetical protein
LAALEFDVHGQQATDVPSCRNGNGSNFKEMRVEQENGAVERCRKFGSFDSS